MSSEAFLIDCTSRINTNHFKCWFWSVWTSNSTYVTSCFKCLYTVIIQERGRNFYFLYFLCYPLTRPRLKSTLPPIIGKKLWDLSSVDYFPSGTSALRTYLKLCTVLAKFLLNLYSVNTKQMYTSLFATLYLQIGSGLCFRERMLLIMLIRNFKFFRKKNGL